MYETRDDVEPEVKATFKEWIDNMDDDDLTLAIKEKLSNSDIPNELKN